MIQGGCTVAEFGTRRRRSYLGQRIIMEGLMRANQDFADAAQSATGKISGTSNVFLAMKYDLVPVGTIAHVSCRQSLVLSSPRCCRLTASLRCAHRNGPWA